MSLRVSCAFRLTAFTLALMVAFATIAVTRAADTQEPPFTLSAGALPPLSNRNEAQSGAIRQSTRGLGHRIWPAR
jgi:hypothetical protein